MSEVKTPTPARRFRGNHLKQIDAKNRVGIPGLFRSLLEGDRVFLLKGLDPKDHYLEVWPAAAWESFCDEIDRMPGAQQRRRVLRGYVSSAAECKLDPQGRIVLPPYYREFAGIVDDVLWVGAGSMMELWAKSRFEARDDEFRSEAYQALIDHDDHFTG